MSSMYPMSQALHAGNMAQAAHLRQCGMPSLLPQRQSSRSVCSRQVVCAQAKETNAAAGSKVVTPKKLSEEIVQAAAAALKEVKVQADQRISALEAENQQLKLRLAELEAAVSVASAAAGFVPDAEDTSLSLLAQATAAAAASTAATATLSSSTSKILWPSVDEEPPFWTRWPTEAAAASNGAIARREGSGEGGEFPVDKDPESIHVVHVTAEMAPLAKVGGLGDVVTGLGRASLARGHRVEVMLPFYECLDINAIEDLTSVRSFGSYWKGDFVGVEAFSGKISGVPVILLRPENHFFLGGRIYGGSYNELEAYLFFSRACLEFMQVTGSQPDIIHVHEWHTAAVALLYWDMYNKLSLTKPRIILTIHNMEHHGECRWEQLDMCGLDGRSYLDVEKAMDDRTIGHNPERLSLLKGGIVYSNTVTTVSPTYAQETLCGGWLADTLDKYRSKYVGVLNGIDTEMWDPATDPHLPAPFTSSSLRGKQLCKHYLQRGLGLGLEIPSDVVLKATAGAGAGSDELLPVADKDRKPLVVCVTRLVAQKGIHLIRYAIWRTRELGGQFVLLGSSPDGRTQGDFVRIAEELQEEDSVRLVLTYSETLAHLLFAAADVILVPSMFEPCGLTQMIGMRYGVLPVVRRTGGLADTVFDVDDQSKAEIANGFVFDGINEDALNSALDRAIRYYKERPDWWAQITSKVMGIDNSWNKAAGEYMSLYNSIRVRWP